MERHSQEMELVNEKQMVNRASVASRRCTMRVIHDPTRQMMLVYEADPTLADVGSTVLVFETRNASWHVPKYPSNWRGLNDDELWALTAQGVEVRRSV